MSLQIWLPLTKDTRNQGLSKVTVTNNGATFNSAGKLGGTYEFASGKRIQTTLPSASNLNSKAISFACWIYITSWNSSYDCFMSIADGTNWTQSRATLCRNNTASTLTWTIANGTSRAYVNTTTALSLNTWTHVACTYNGSSLKVYINGVLDNTAYTSISIEYAGAFNIGGWSGANYPFNGRLNDARVYSHCLSPMEVKELSKGLILHYPLNRGGWGQENLLHNTFDFTGRNAVNTTIVTDSTDGTYAKTTPSTVDWTLIQIGPTFAASLISGKTITVTCEVRAFDLPTSTTANYCYLTLNAFNSANSFSRTGNKDHPYASNILKEGEWVTLSYQLDVNFNNWTVGSGYTTSDFQYITLGLYNHSGKRIDFRHPKIEIGNKATPWCPNSSDALATTMGLNDVIEYDISGYNNNGIRNDNLFIGSSFSSEFTGSNFVGNASTDWTKYLRYYNGSASNHSFSNGVDTVTLNSAANLGICFARKATDIYLDPTSYYTISCEAKSTQTTTPLCIGLSYYTTTNGWIWRGGSNAKAFSSVDTWQKFTLTFKPDANTQCIDYCFTVLGKNGGTDTFSIRNCKLEKGSAATPWNEGKSMTWTSGSPKYEVSTHIGATSSKIHISNFPTSGFGNSYSFAWWGKRNSNSPMFWGFGDGIRLNGMYLGYLWNTGDSANNPLYEIGTTTRVTVPSLNTWHHYVMTGNGTKCYVYLDGELWAEAKTYKAINGTSIWINGWNNNAEYVSNNTDISDFRIYATALSASDVKSLYQNGATIDANGTIHGQIR